MADTTAGENSGVKEEWKGKYIGLTERNTVYRFSASEFSETPCEETEESVPTGLDYLKSLGITHVQLMPSYDFGSIDESRLNEPQYNWGYDPVNYNIPEGSYSTDPFHGEVRIKEFKKMVQAIHAAGLATVNGQAEIPGISAFVAVKNSKF